VITTVAENGTLGYSGDDGPATSAGLNSPTGVVADGLGNIYFADSGNNRIREISNDIITTVAGGGASLGDNGPATSPQLNSPNGVAIDSAGSLYIADTGNNRIRKVSNGVITTVAGNGTDGFSGDNGPATSAELKRPYGVAVGSGGGPYIADYGNSRMRLLTPVYPPSQSYTFLAIDLPGSTSTVPRGINDTGQIVGTYTDDSGSHGFLYAGNTFSTIDVPGA
jgi:probable HAF family extracellular repeat protein